MKKACSSDYVSIKRQIAIYSEIKNNVTNGYTANPVKHNGLQYNNNISISKNDAACPLCKVRFAKSFQMMTDYYKGQNDVFYLCLCKFIEEGIEDDCFIGKITKEDCLNGKLTQ
jgi:hypothetical protein